MVGGLILLFLVLTVMALWVERTKKQLAHTERMKALELGQPLPDAAIARAQALGSRAWAAGTIGILVPLAMIGGGAWGTVFILHQDYLYHQVALLCTLWGICGGVSLVVATVSLAIIGSLGFHESETKPSLAPVQPRADKLSPVIRE
jgi:hypothetical protein